MAAELTFGRRLVAVLVPTRAQALVCVVISLIFLALSQLEQLLTLVGVSDVAVNATRGELQSRFGVILKSPIASSAALVAFWAVVGLTAYLLCWGAYNLLIEARNEVTLETQYTNRGHWRGARETLAVKAAAAIFLAIAVGLLKPGLVLWLVLATPLLSGLSLAGLALALAAALGLALQLYLVLALALVTFTPWYRAEAFTDAT